MASAALGGYGLVVHKSSRIMRPLGPCMLWHQGANSSGPRKRGADGVSIWSDFSSTVRSFCSLYEIPKPLRTPLLNPFSCAPQPKPCYS
jgi:hypothetical protein